jgi:UDPglucose 6-dehydrogenase
MEEARHMIGDKIVYCKNEYDTLINADALMIVTEWADFRSPNFDKIKTLLNNSIIFDGRNIFEGKEMNDLGFEYYGIGTRND